MSASTVLIAHLRRISEIGEGWGSEDDIRAVCKEAAEALSLAPEDEGGWTVPDPLAEQAAQRDALIEQCAAIADKYRGRYYEKDKYGADIGAEIRALKDSSQPQVERSNG